MSLGRAVDWQAAYRELGRKLAATDGELATARARIDQLAAGLQEAIDIAAMSLNHLDRNAEAKANRVSTLHALLACALVADRLAKLGRLREAIEQVARWRRQGSPLAYANCVDALLAAAREVVG